MSWQGCIGPFNLISILPYIIGGAIIASLILELARRGYNPISYIQDKIEERRLDAALKAGMNWEQYKTKYNIQTNTEQTKEKKE